MSSADPWGRPLMRGQTPDKVISRLDAHVHVWSDDEAAYPFGPHDGVPRPAEPFTMTQLASAMDATGVAHALAIQPRLYGYDHAYLFEAASSLAGRLRVMPLINSVRPCNVEAMDALADHAVVAGFRVVTLGREPVELLLGEQAHRLWARMVSRVLPVGLLIEPQHLAAVATLADREPDLRIVVDHCGNIGAGAWRRWGPVLLALSRYTNVYVKISALGHLSDDPAPYDDMHAHVLELIRSFGAARLLWGSDWPHAYGYGHYEDSPGAVAAILHAASTSDRNRVLSETARSLFAFPEPGPR